MVKCFIPGFQALSKPTQPCEVYLCSPRPFHNPPASSEWALSVYMFQFFSVKIVKWFTSISRFMLAVTQLQALTGPEGSSQCLSGLLAFTTARSIICVHATASTDWTRRVQSVLVMPASFHHGQISYRHSYKNFSAQDES